MMHPATVKWIENWVRDASDQLIHGCGKNGSVKEMENFRINVSIRMLEQVLAKERRNEILYRKFDGLHEWKEDTDSEWYDSKSKYNVWYCRKCGVVRRADLRNKPCVGKVGLRL